MQSFKPYADRLEASGHTIVSRPNELTDLAFAIAHRHRDVSRLRVAQAWRALQPDGYLIVSGSKTNGIDALLKEIKKRCQPEGALPKSHGKVFWIRRDGHDADLFSDWLALADLRKNKDGFHTSVESFSADRIDKGSCILARSFTEDLKGAVADLGAGWGYLAAILLEQSPKIASIDLFEAEQTSLSAAKANIIDERARFHWADVSTLTGYEKTFDVVVSNPPFHQSRKSAPELGQAFITTAAKVLKPSGQLLLVANRQLPYEDTLNKKFRAVEVLADEGGYKVINARNPRPGKHR